MKYAICIIIYKNFLVSIRSQDPEPENFSSYLKIFLWPVGLEV